MKYSSDYLPCCTLINTKPALLVESSQFMKNKTHEETVLQFCTPDTHLKTHMRLEIMQWNGQMKHVVVDLKTTSYM